MSSGLHVSETEVGSGHVVGLAQVPVFSHAEEIASKYGAYRRVRLTIETDWPDDDPPLVNGRPTCCQWANEERDFLSLGDDGRWYVGGPDGRRAAHCINCGTKLPEAAP